MTDIISQLETVIKTEQVQQSLLEQLSPELAEVKLAEITLERCLSQDDPWSGTAAALRIGTPKALGRLGLAYLEHARSNGHDAPIINLIKASQYLEQGNIPPSEAFAAHLHDFDDIPDIGARLYIHRQVKGREGELKELMSIYTSIRDNTFNFLLPTDREFILDQLATSVGYFAYSDGGNVTESSWKTYLSLTTAFAVNSANEGLVTFAARVLYEASSHEHKPEGWDSESTNARLRPAISHVRARALMERRLELADALLRMEDFRWTSVEQRKKFIDEWFAEEVDRQEPYGPTMWHRRMTGQPPTRLFNTGIQYSKLHEFDPQFQEDLDRRAYYALERDEIDFSFQVFLTTRNETGVKRTLQRALIRGYYERLWQFVEVLGQASNEVCKITQSEKLSLQGTILEHMVTNRAEAIESWRRIETALPEERRNMGEDEFTEARYKVGDWPVPILTSHWNQLSVYRALPEALRLMDENPDLYNIVSQWSGASTFAGTLDSTKIKAFSALAKEYHFERLRRECDSLAELMDGADHQAEVIFQDRISDTRVNLLASLQQFTSALYDFPVHIPLETVDWEDRIKKPYNILLSACKPYGVEDSAAFRELLLSFNPNQGSEELKRVCQRNIPPRGPIKDPDHKKYLDALVKIDDKEFSLRYARKLLRRGKIGEAESVYRIFCPSAPYGEIRSHFRKQLLKPFRKDVGAGLELLLAAANSEFKDEFEISTESASFETGFMAEVQKVSFRSPKLLGDLAIVVKIEDLPENIEQESRIYRELQQRGFRTPTPIANGLVNGRAIGVYEFFEGKLLTDVQITPSLFEKVLDFVDAEAAALVQVISPDEVGGIPEKNFYSLKIASLIERYLGIGSREEIFRTLDSTLDNPAISNLRIITRDANPTNIMVTPTGDLATFDMNVLRTGFLYEEWVRILDYPDLIPDTERQDRIDQCLNSTPGEVPRSDRQTEAQILHSLAIYRNLSQAAYRFEDGHPDMTRWYFKRAMMSAEALGDQRINEYLTEMAPRIDTLCQPIN